MNILPSSTFLSAQSEILTHDPYPQHLSTCKTKTLHQWTITSPSFLPSVFLINGDIDLKVCMEPGGFYKRHWRLNWCCNRPNIHPEKMSFCSWSHHTRFTSLGHSHFQVTAPAFSHRRGSLWLAKMKSQTTRNQIHQGLHLTGIHSTCLLSSPGYVTLLSDLTFIAFSSRENMGYVILHRLRNTVFSKVPRRIWKSVLLTTL